MADEIKVPDVSKIRDVYFSLESMWHVLKDRAEYVIVESSLALYVHSLSELEDEIEYNFDVFLPEILINEEQKRTCSVSDLCAQLSALLGKLRSAYIPEVTSPFVPVPTSTVNTTYITQTQDSRQEMVINQAFIENVSNKISELSGAYKESTPEKGFIDKLKSGFATVKDLASLVTLITSSAEAVGLAGAKLHDVLTALGLDQIQF